MFQIPTNFIDAFFAGMRIGLTEFDPAKIGLRQAFEFIESEHLKASLALKGSMANYGGSPIPQPLAPEELLEKAPAPQAPDNVTELKKP